jgi:hypothetical protein
MFSRIGLLSVALGAALDGIAGVRVYVYEKVEDVDELRAFVDDASGRLERDGWSPAVSISEDDERVRIYMKTDGSNLSGLTMMVLDTSEAIFINVAGDITPAQLGRLLNEVGVTDVLADIGGTPGAER